ncbi:MAG: hypothetical protein A2941_00300 [Candidatus Yanofskybacteria bacterium RIFCSPLOWO2_01_FULL_49_17]|uniref:DUF11 domain-containing protein n=1 Tax=Candidatus Yanofskybacteria bacterium RIFCSPLOWO2_01_FULL_49_17 TaxID=1802700 RepID=A0A1F8GPE4_9BACT|nr:MAG: hypothetical protein A2941_00300 [Candidatus Yanofskybacteria bacterium RIFCSPLOWO2_01_FULL_49_17]
MSRLVLKWLIVFAIGLGIIAGLIFWFGDSSFSESRVNLTIDGPTQAAVGDEVVYKVKYENQTNTGLRNVRLTFTYPDNSVIMKDGSVVSDSSGVETVDEASLPAGASREQEFHAFLIGDRGNILVAKARLDFDADNLRSSFAKDATRATTITSLPVSLTLSAPPTATTGSSIAYILDYRNESSAAISDIRFLFDYPDGFSPRQFSPSPNAGNNSWSAQTLAVSAGKRISITGTISGSEGQSKPVKVTLQRKINGRYIDYESASATTIISSPLLGVSLKANDTSGYIAHPSDTLQYDVTYKNNSTFTLTGLTLTVRLDGNMYDLSTINVGGGFFDSSSGTITWNSTVIPAFTAFGPRQNGSVKFSVKLKQAPSTSGSGSLFVRATAQLVTPNVPSGMDSDQVSASSDLIIKITSQPTFNQTAYVNDAAFGSSGPWPPKAGSETAITVHWKLTNPGNDLSNAKLTGTLPLGVTWENVTSVTAGQPQPTFNQNTSQVIWDIGTLPQGVGTQSAVYELVFQVKIKPSMTQVGLPATVVQNPALSGTDSYTQQSIVVSAPDVTTNITIDQSGTGIIQQ